MLSLKSVTFDLLITLFNISYNNFLTLFFIKIFKFLQQIIINFFITETSILKLFPNVKMYYYFQI